MKNQIRNTLSIIIFALGTNSFANSKTTPTPAYNGDLFFEQYFDPFFFNRSYDPFEEMRHIRDQMLKEFNVAEKDVTAFDSWFERKYGGSVADIHQREDRNFVYYDIVVNDLTNEKVDVKVQNGNIILSGFQEKKGDHISESSSFLRTFPVPQNIDTKHVEIDQGVGKITVKFKKLFPWKARTENRNHSNAPSARSLESSRDQKKL